MPPATRRQVLATGATALGTATAGCIAGIEEPEESVDVSIENDDSTAYTIGVSVDIGNVRVFEHRATVEPGVSTGGSFENPEDTTTAAVSAQLESGPEATKSVGVGAGSGIHYIEVRIADDGTLAILAVRT